MMTRQKISVLVPLTQLLRDARFVIVASIMGIAGIMGTMALIVPSLALATEPPASAEEPLDVEIQPHARLQRSHSVDATGTEANIALYEIIYSPSGCFGQSDNPHKSDHYDDTVAAESRTDCGNNTVPELWVDNQLWEKRWWGWDRVGTRGSDHDTYKRSVRGTASWECRNNHFKVTADHKVIDVDQETYTEESQNWSDGRIDCG